MKEYEIPAATGTTTVLLTDEEAAARGLKPLEGEKARVVANKSRQAVNKEV